MKVTACTWTDEHGTHFALDTSDDYVAAREHAFIRRVWPQYAPRLVVVELTELAEKPTGFFAGYSEC